MDAFKTSFITEEKLPLVVEPSRKQMSRKAFFEALEKEASTICEKVGSIGGVLFRNCPIHSVDDFDKVIQTLNLGKCVDYIGGDSPRTKVKGEIYTSTEAPPWFKIPLHNELSFVKNYPHHIYFFCETPSPTGGETILADARAIYQAIDEQVKQRFVKKGLCYKSNYYYRNKVIEFLNKRGHKTWIDVFETTKKDEVEKKCEANEFGYKWTKNDWLEITQTRPAVMEHPDTKEKIWFNQVHLYDFNPKLMGWKSYVGAKLLYLQKHTQLHAATYADKTPIERKDIYHILDVLDQKTVSFPWHKGDVLVLDNILTMHGRAPFSGKRRILAAMSR